MNRPSPYTTLDHVAESNRIEGINRLPTQAEADEFARFMGLSYITVEDLIRFVYIYQPGARLRNREGLDVRVGSHYPPQGGPGVLGALTHILEEANRDMGLHKPAYSVHLQYEGLHPFTDGNGRSGRMLWHWMMHTAPLGFLHTFYYQTLQASNK